VRRSKGHSDSVIRTGKLAMPKQAALCRWEMRVLQAAAQTRRYGNYLIT